MIYTILTGGTIGSARGQDGGVSVNESAKVSLIERFKSRFPNQADTEFETVSPISILSENLEAEHILAIASAIEEGLARPETEGIIVTHGTDTLQYTAAVLSYIFSDISIPIVIVSANYILEDTASNGDINFFFAVKFIRNRSGMGVFVSYCNDGELPTIHRGNRLGNPVVFSDYVYSVRGQFYGSFRADPKDTGTWEAAEFALNRGYTVDPDNRQSLFPSGDYVLNETSAGILKVYAAPGIVYPAIPEYTRAILLHSYHSGTICLDVRLQEFLGEAHFRDIPVFLLGLAGDAVKYESMKPYEEYGIIPLYNSAPIAQYCKLWLLLSAGRDFVEGMLTPYSAER